MAKPLEKEFQYYLDHQEELVAQYGGKYIVIKNCAVIDAYDTEIEAISETTKNHELGTFLVQKCESGEGAYTVKFRSRAVLTHDDWK